MRWHTCHGLTVDEACGTGRRDVLATFDEVGLEHDTENHL